MDAVFATHNNYHLWGSPSDSVKTYICVFVGRRDIEKLFESVVGAHVAVCPDCSRPQQRVPIYIARGPKFSITKEWAKFKLFI